MFPEFVIGGGVLALFVAVSVGVVCGMAAYGLLTGFMLRRLLIRSVVRREEAVVGQFDQ